MATKKTTTMTYLERISQGTEAKKQQQLSHSAEQAKLQLQADILETKSKVAELTQRLEDLKSASPLSPSSIVSTQVELNAYNEGLAHLNDLMTELFPG